MRRSRSIIAVCLTAALAVSGMVTPAQGNAAVKKSTDSAAIAATGSATDVASGSATDVTSGPATGLNVDAAKLKKDVDAFNARLFTLNDKEKVRVQSYTLAKPQYQMAYYATNVLGAKNPKLKYGVGVIDKQNNGELFVITGKKLSIYDYTFEMMADGYKAKPIATIKNAKEVRIKSAKKELFTVKSKKGKTVSYTTYKYVFEKIKKKSVYSVTGKTYKKGAKKISSKAFKKFLKSYKKQALVEMTGTEFAAYDTGYDYSGYMYITKDFYEVSGKYDAMKQGSNDWVVMRHEADDKTNPYKAFGAIDSVNKYRYVFGDDEKDWKSFVKEVMDIAEYISPIKDSIEGKTMEVYINEYLSKKDDTVYGLSIKAEDGCEADYGYNVHVDESGDHPHFKSVELLTSVGVITDKWEFLYGDEAEIDGEMYEPGSDAECYADADYVKAVGEKVRTLKYEVAGTVKEAYTVGTAFFCLYSKTGKFSGTVNGKPVTDLVAHEGDAEVIAALNPPIKEGGYGDPTITDLKWIADALK